MTNSLAKYIFTINIKNPLYAEIIQNFDAEVEAIDLANVYCQTLVRPNGQRLQLPAGGIYITVIPENRKGILAERIC